MSAGPASTSQHPGSAATLTAGPNARLILVLPFQHIGEEASPPGSEAPLSLPVAGSGATVPVWHGFLSAPTRLAFTVAVGTQMPLTAEGVLGAAASAALITPGGVPGPDDTAIELPWRVVIAPRGRSGTGQVACRHPSTPGGPSVTGLWRTRLVDASAPADATLTDAGLLVTAPDLATADVQDLSAVLNHGTASIYAPPKRGYYATSSPLTDQPIVEWHRHQITAPSIHRRSTLKAHFE